MPTHVPRRDLHAVALAAALALVLAACSAEVNVDVGGGDASTYSDNGVSFDYPGDWDEISLEEKAASTGTEVWSAAFGPSTTSFVAVTAYQVNVEVTESNIGDLLPEIRSTIASISEQAGGEVLTDFTRSDMGGLPGYAVETTAVVPGGTDVRSVLVLAFDGTIEYFVNCQFTEDAETEIREGCDLIRSSFEVTS